MYMIFDEVSGFQPLSAIISKQVLRTCCLWDPNSVPLPVGVYWVLGAQLDIQWLFLFQLILKLIYKESNIISMELAYDQPPGYITHV